MPKRVALEELIDAHDVARILGLSQRNTVSQYQRRYPDMPRPVLDLGPGRPSLWLRPQIERWYTRQVELGKTRSKRPTSR
jgi:glutathione-regulated potassium-efflux system ancillary protein KefG